MRITKHILQNSGSVLQVDRSSSATPISHLLYCVKSVRIRSYSGRNPVQMWENIDQNNFEYGYFSRPY